MSSIYFLRIRKTDVDVLKIKHHNKIFTVTDSPMETVEVCIDE